MNLQAIENRARKMQAEYGGVIFAFPIEESNPLSKYAVATLFDGKCSVYPEPLEIEEAAGRRSL